MFEAVESSRKDNRLNKVNTRQRGDHTKRRLVHCWQAFTIYIKFAIHHMVQCTCETHAPDGNSETGAQIIEHTLHRNKTTQICQPRPTGVGTCRPLGRLVTNGFESQGWHRHISPASIHCAHPFHTLCVLSLPLQSRRSLMPQLIRMHSVHGSGLRVDV